MDCLHQSRVSILNLRINDQDIMHLFTGNFQSNPISGYNRRIEEDYDLLESPSSGQLEEKQSLTGLLAVFALIPIIAAFIVAIPTLILPLLVVLAGIFREIMEIVSNTYVGPG